jgi:hypothetical protein
MRWAFVACIVACVGGCTSSDPPPLPNLASKPCALVAQAKMIDGRRNDYSETEQQIVFRGAYADCVKWEAKGYEPPIP